MNKTTQKTTCPICCKETEGALGWYGYECKECGYMYDGELNRVVRNRREILGLTRRQMADKVGLKRATVYKYEKIWPSKKYLDQTMLMIIQSYK
jgi:DNA-binding XRE family transcriptional regulator